MHPPFDEALVERLRDRFVTSGLEGNRYGGEARVPTEPPGRLDALTDEERRACLAAGEAALAGGRAAVLVMAGGMATRFGSGAKAVVPVLGDDPRTSFLAIKLADAVRRCPQVSAVIMHSHATGPAVLEHLDRLDWCGVPPDRRHHFAQASMPRLLEDGSLAIERHPELPRATAFAPAGHGDAAIELARSGVLGRLRAAGVETIMISNVDNLGATLDPVVLGWHLRANTPVTAEVVRRRPGDVGASVVERADGRRIVVEDFRRIDPTGDRFPHFSINTLWTSAPALAEPPDLDWFFVPKQATWPDGSTRTVIQLERLVGQITEHRAAAYLEVPGERFVPIKAPTDLQTHATALRRAAVRAGALRDGG